MNCLEWKQELLPTHPNMFMYVHAYVYTYIDICTFTYIYNARLLFVVWAIGHSKIGKCVIVFQVSGYLLTLSLLVGVLSFSIQKPSVTNRMSSLDISPMTDDKNCVSYALFHYTSEPK